MFADSALSIYIHWPFCVSKCPYCDFNSHVRDTIDTSAYARAFHNELAHYMPMIETRGVKSVFFGGGTPSLMPPELTHSLLERLRPFYVPRVEITLEANPSSSERAKLRAFKQAGINRLSIGVQSFRDDALRFLGRAHSGTLARRTVDTAADLFAERFSFDLIYALPGISVRQWQADLRTAFDYGSHHLSLYQLTIERGTPFYYAHKEGRFAVPNEDTAAYLHDITTALTRDAGYNNYEISNYAKPHAQSRHNLQYWRYGDYIGIGPGAHGRYIHADGIRRSTITIHKPEEWVQQTAKSGHGIQKSHVISSTQSHTEALLTGLRLREGINKRRLAELANGDYDAIIAPEKEQALIHEGLIAKDAHYLRCTHRGFLKHSSIIAYLKPDTGVI